MFDLPPPTQCQLATLNFNVNVFRVKVLEKTDQIVQITRLLPTWMSTSTENCPLRSCMDEDCAEERKIIIMSLMISKVAIDLYPT